MLHVRNELELIQTFYSQTNKNVLIVKSQTVQLLGQDLHLAKSLDKMQAGQTVLKHGMIQ